MVNADSARIASLLPSMGLGRAKRARLDPDRRAPAQVGMMCMWVSFTACLPLQTSWISTCVCVCVCVCRFKRFEPCFCRAGPYCGAKTWV